MQKKVSFIIRICAVSLPLFLLAAGASATGLDGLLPHRAVYDLSLKDASDRSGIEGMDGRIVYEMTGSRCEGFAVRFRFFTNVQTARKSFTNDQRTTSFESGDGKTFRFVTQSYLNGQLEQDLRGSATDTGEATEVALEKPQKSQLKLSKSIFMTEHIGGLINAAKAGQTIYTATVYDASEKGDELVDTTAIIGKAKTGATPQDGEPEEVARQFEGKVGWPVSVSYFNKDDTAASGEKLPVYQVSFLMHESGVSRSLRLQYDDYALRGDLKKIEFLQAEPCK